MFTPSRKHPSSRKAKPRAMLLHPPWLYFCILLSILCFAPNVLYVAAWTQHNINVRNSAHWGIDTALAIRQYLLQGAASMIRGGDSLLLAASCVITIETIGGVRVVLLKDPASFAYWLSVKAAGIKTQVATLIEIFKQYGWYQHWASTRSFEMLGPQESKVVFASPESVLVLQQPTCIEQLGGIDGPRNRVVSFILKQLTHWTNMDSALRGISQTAYKASASQPRIGASVDGGDLLFSTQAIYRQITGNSSQKPSFLRALLLVVLRNGGEAQTATFTSARGVSSLVECRFENLSQEVISHIATEYPSEGDESDDDTSDDDTSVDDSSVGEDAASNDDMADDDESESDSSSSMSDVDDDCSMSSVLSDMSSDDDDCSISLPDDDNCSLYETSDSDSDVSS